MCKTLTWMLITISCLIFISVSPVLADNDEGEFKTVNINKLSYEWLLGSLSLYANKNIVGTVNAGGFGLSKFGFTIYSDIFKLTFLRNNKNLPLRNGRISEYLPLRFAFTPFYKVDKTRWRSYSPDGTLLKDRHIYYTSAFLELFCELSHWQKFLYKKPEGQPEIDNKEIPPIVTGGIKARYKGVFNLEIGYKHQHKSYYEFYNHGYTPSTDGFDISGPYFSISFSLGWKGISRSTLLIPVSPEPISTPDLRLELDFMDDNANGALDVDEKAWISGRIVNNGDGKAEDVKAKIYLQSQNIGIKVPQELMLGTLQSRSSKNISFEIESDNQIRDGIAMFTVRATEKNGFNASDVSFNVVTHEFEKDIDTTTVSRTTIAVLQLDSRGVSESDASALTDRLRTELFRTKKYKVVEREIMDKMLEEQKFQMTGCTSTECIVQAGEILGVQYMIAGSISKVGDVLSVSSRIVDVESGEIINVATYDNDEGNIGNVLKYGMEYIAYVLAGK